MRSLKSEVQSPRSRGRGSGATAGLSPRLAHGHTPLLRVACGLLLALALLAATCGYWAVVRAETLRTRDDNPRRVLYEQRIVRGRILDRGGTVLADVEVADDGTVTRRYPVPEAAPAVGYASLRYGTGGIEAAFDTELRGEAGRSAWQAAWDDLLHRPPHGYDVQLTLDAALQTQAQEALTGQAGAVVLLDASTGEILALVSSPTFDPESLDDAWEMLSEDPSAPLVNRATQGLYQPGAALETIILAQALDEGLADLENPIANATTTLSVNGTMVGCSAALSEPITLAEAYAAACPAPVADLGGQLGADGFAEAIGRWGLTIPPVLEIPAEAADWDTDALSTTSALRQAQDEALRAEAIGQGNLTASPLQMALVAGTLANDGEMPAPRLVLQVRDGEGRWRKRSAAGESHAVLKPALARRLLDTWQRYEDGSTTADAPSTLRTGIAGHWGVAVAGEEQPPHTWFLGVAPADAPRYAVAILLEHPTDPHRAVAVGSALLEAAIGRAGE